MPDGKIFTPRQPYDATLIYLHRNDRMNAQKIYDRGKKVKVGKITVENDSSAAGSSAEATGYGQPPAPAEAAIGHIRRQ